MPIDRRPAYPLTYKRFNGVSDSDSFSINLSAQTKISVSYLAIDGGGNSEGRAFDITQAGTDFATLNRSPGAVAIKGSTGGARRLWTFTRPSQNALHHYLWVFDLTAQTATLTVDGSGVTLTQAEAGSPSGNFGTHTWFLMTDNGSAYSEGILANLGIWAGTETITAAEITALGLGVKPSNAHGAGLLKELVY